MAVDRASCERLVIAMLRLPEKKWWDSISLHSPIFHHLCHVKCKENHAVKQQFNDKSAWFYRLNDENLIHKKFTVVWWSISSVYLFYLLSQHRPALASLPPRMSHRRAPAWRRETLDPQRGRSCSRKLKNPHRPLWRVPRLAKLQAFWWINMREIRALGKIRNLFDMNFSCSFCSAAMTRGETFNFSYGAESWW